MARGILGDDERAYRTGFARSQVRVKTVLTVGLTLLGLAAAVWALSKTLLAVGILVASALVAVAVNHGVEALERRGLRRWIAIVFVVLALLAAFAGVLVLVIPTAVEQVRNLIDRAPTYLEQVRDSVVWRRLDERLDLDRRIAAFLESGTTVAGGALQALGNVARWTVAAFTAAFTVIFMLIFGGRLVRAALAEAVPAMRERYERVLEKIYRAIGGYLSGLALIALVNAALTSTFLAIVGVPFFLPLGILSGLGSFIPYVGAITAGVLISVVALATAGPWTGLAAIAYYVTYQQVVENHLLVPLVYKRTVHLDPLVTLVAVIFLGDLAGVVGAIIAVPAVAVGQIVLREVLLLRRERMHVPATGEVTDALEPPGRIVRPGEDRPGEDGPDRPH